MSSLLQISEPGTIPLTPNETDLHAVGIDLGTTHSLIAVSNHQHVKVIKDEQGRELLPSVVAYSDKNILIGEAARDHIQVQPAHVVHSIKRLMGRSSVEAKALVRSYEVVEEDERVFRLRIGERVLTPIEISAELLKGLKKQAENYLNTPIHQAVITVPAYFDDAARTATRDAARLAGLQVLRLINEPTAAALAYGLEHKQEGLYAVYDWGGGTFDFSLLRLEDNVFQVLATGGDIALGGDDIDTEIVNYLKNHFDSSASIDPRWLKRARTAKEYISVGVDNIWREEDLFLTAEDLDRLSAPLVDKTLAICQKVLQDASITPSQLQAVVLVGGSTRLPLVKKRVAQFFGQQPYDQIDPDTVVAIGAALHAEALTHGSDQLLLDVCPLSLGLETMGGVVEKIIYRNSPIPASYTQEFTTYQDNQTAIIIHVVQGEREFVNDCRSLALFTLKGIPPLKAGVARIAVTFTIDADGVLMVSAQEKTTEIYQHVIVQPAYGLTEQEIQHMVLESMAQGRLDMEKRLQIEEDVQAAQLKQTLDRVLGNE